MPRRLLIRQSEFPYHITTRTNHKTWFQIPMYEVWDICKEALIYANLKNPVKIHCFVLMSNHYHLVVSTPDCDIDRFMMHFNRKLSLLIQANKGVINHKFSNRYKWSIISTNSYLKNVYRYVYQNPVRAKVVEKSIDYPYSSLHFTRFEGRKINFFPHFIYRNEKIWFEQSLGSDFDMTIRKGLSQARFKVSSKASTYIKKTLSREG